MISLILLKLFTFSQILQGVPKLLHATVYGAEAAVAVFAQQENGCTREEAISQAERAKSP